MATMETMRDDDDGAAVVGRGLGLCERRAGSSGAVKPRPRIEKRSVWRNNYSSKALDCLVEVALSPTAALDLSGRNNVGESVATLRTDKCGTTTPSRAGGEGDEGKGKGKDNDDDDSAAMGRYWSCSSAMKAPEPAAAMTPSPSPSPSPASSLNHRAATGFYQQQQQHQQQEQQQKEQQKEQQQERQREQKLKMKRGLSSSSWSGMSSHRAGRSSSSSSLRVHADQPHSKRFTPRFKSLLDISC